MRGTVAKRLRRKAFGLSAKEPTRGMVRWKLFRNEEGKTVDRHGTYYLEGYRKVYQNLKKEYKHGKRST